MGCLKQRDSQCLNPADRRNPVCVENAILDRNIPNPQTANQWVLLRAHKRRGQREWTPGSFIGSAKAVLSRCIRGNGIQLNDTAKENLRGLPNTFRQWLARFEPQGL